MTMPDLIGKTLAYADAVLADMGVIDRSYQDEDGQDLGYTGNENRKVTATDPKAGDEVEALTPVTITLL